MTTLDPKALDAAARDIVEDRGQVWDELNHSERAVEIAYVGMYAKAFLSALNGDDVVERCKYAMGAKLLPIHDDDLDLLARTVLAELGIGEG